MICFKCGKEIVDDYYMIPIERPVYGNLFFHKDICYQEIKASEVEYLIENYDRVIETLIKKKK